MDKNVVKLLITVQEELKLLSMQIHEVGIIALATKDTLANLHPQAAETYEMAYADHSKKAVPPIADVIWQYDETIELLNGLL